MYATAQKVYGAKVVLVNDNDTYYEKPFMVDIGYFCYRYYSFAYGCWFLVSARDDQEAFNLINLQYGIDGRSGADMRRLQVWCGDRDKYVRVCDYAANSSRF